MSEHTQSKAERMKEVLKTRVWPTLVWMGKTGIPTSSGVLLARASERIVGRIPPRLRDRASGFMGWLERTMSMPKGAAISLGLHGILIAFAYFGLPWFARDVDFVDIPITVEVVNVTDKTSAPPTRPQKKVAEAKPEKKPAPKPEPQVKAANTPPPPPPPRPTEDEVAIVPTPEVKPQAKKKPEKTPEKARTTPDYSKLTPPRKPEVRPKKSQDFASALKTLETIEDTPPPEKEEKKKSDQEKAFEQVLANALDQPQARGTSTEPLSISEIDLVRRQIAQCWNMPAGAKGAEDLVVEIKMQMNPNGEVQTARVTDTARMNRDPFFRAAAEIAMRAVLNPKCSPLKLPPEKYEIWRDLTLTFDPKEMLGL